MLLGQIHKFFMIVGVLSIIVIGFGQPHSIHADSGGVISFGEPIEGDLTPTEKDTWTFWAEADQSIAIAAERSPVDQEGDLNLALELYDPANVLIASDDNSGRRSDAALFGVHLSQSGLYAIRVLSNGTSGTYRLTLAEVDLPEGCQTPAGAMARYQWQSVIAGEALAYRVYMPPCYEATGLRYPYIILMHGSISTDSHWDEIGMDEAVAVGVALGRIPPIALVMPYGGEIANMNIFSDTYSYENAILREIIPIVENSFCLDGTRRAIGGISRGGFWAYEIGFRHPDLFDAIGGHSPVFDLTHAPPAYNPLMVVETLDWTEDSPRLYIDRGEDDYWRDNIDLMAPRLEAAGIPFTFDLNQGEHSEAYWTAHLNDYLDFYTAGWQLEDYQPCQG
ncbi:MAG: hypothetical protein H6673_08390 [Anaerolineales bacterium]|nr:hypothetical protein [Anaerolineales bacterium]